MCKYCEVYREVTPRKYGSSAYVGDQMLPFARVGCQIYYSEDVGYSFYVVGETKEWTAKISYCPFCGRKLED